VAQAQARWTVDPKMSLAWWQMNPHMNHLWATTCPQEPSWRPGEDRNAGWYMRNMIGASALDSVNVPLYPRYAARDVCADAVRGEVETPDTVTWRGVRGEVVVKADQLVSGQPQRDKFARDGVLEAQAHPEIRFAIDSLVGVARLGDTLSGSVMGVFTLRGVSRPSVASVRMWPEAGGLRVVAKFNILAKSLVEDFGMSAYALGLGVGLRIWHHLFMGVDLVMRSEAVAGN
jgi:hypothetical protein